MNRTRRQFLAAGLGSSALVSLSPLTPQFLLRAAQAADAKAGKILVVVQLSGGNDGLNTVIPFDDPIYRRNRVSLAIGADQVLKIDGQLGFHPSMQGFADLLEASKLAIVQGVGYPNPNRSHFESMDIWHTALRESSNQPTGWLGRYVDATFQGGRGDVPAMHLGAEKQPLALAALRNHSPSIQSLESFRLDVDGDDRLRAAIHEIAQARRPANNDLLRFVQQSGISALASSERVEEALGGYKTSIEYPATGLARKLRTVAQLIDAGLTTRVYYLSLNGFDTHSDQADAHASLLAELAGATSAFIRDVSQHGHGDRVLLMTFSEFGRRVKENASRGTDHGAAAPLFLAGDKVKEGLAGEHPPLDDLQDGDIKYKTDFRRVYAGILQQWLGVESRQVLGKDFQPLDLVG